MTIQFHTETILAGALRELLRKLEQHLMLTAPLNVYLAGGMAAHLYTASRATSDIDAEFSARVLVPSDLVVEVTLENGQREVVYFDTNYNPTFALLHENYLDDAIPLDFGIPNLNIFVLAPVDLAVSKIARLNDNDRMDIVALVHAGLTTAKDIESRADEAVRGFVGGLAMLRANVSDAVELARMAEPESDIELGEKPRLAN